MHLTLDMSGQVRFGPDVEWVDAIEYKVCGLAGGKYLVR